MTDTYQPAISTAPCIRLTPMPQLAEARSRDDDWTGTKDAAARRRAQTRLNTRAYRKRKALAKKLDESSNTNPTTERTPIPIPIPLKQETLIECWDDEQQSISMVPAAHLGQLYNAKNPLLADKTKSKSKESQSQSRIVFPLCPDHLITLLQFNALRALVVNRSLITGVLVRPLEDYVENIHVMAYPKRPELLPPTLLPTTLQQTVPHGDWIDMFPSPEGRDRLILAAGTYDEDDLWADCIGGLFEGFPDSAVEQRGMIAWSPPWDITGWEMSEGFLRKWGWLVRGLPGLLEATNRRRMERCEEPLSFDGWASEVTI